MLFGINIKSRHIYESWRQIIADKKEPSTSPVDENIGKLKSFYFTLIYFCHFVDDRLKTSDSNRVKSYLLCQNKLKADENSRGVFCVHELRGNDFDFKSRTDLFFSQMFSPFNVANVIVKIIFAAKTKLFEYFSFPTASNLNLCTLLIRELNYDTRWANRII